MRNSTWTVEKCRVHSTCSRQGVHEQFTFSQRVPARVAGERSDKDVYIGIRAMLGAVDLVQAVAHRIGHEWANIPKETEVRRDDPLPSGDVSLIYLAAVDLLSWTKR